MAVGRSIAPGRRCGWDAGRAARSSSTPVSAGGAAAVVWGSCSGCWPICRSRAGRRGGPVDGAGRVQAGEGVLAGGVQVAPRAGQGGRDAVGEGVVYGQGLLGALLGADGLAQQLAELVGHLPGQRGLTWRLAASSA